MTQEEAIIIKKIDEHKKELIKLDKKSKDIEKGLKLGKKLGLTETDLQPWKDLEYEVLLEKYKINGFIANLQKSCEHDFAMVGTYDGLFGIEVIYECSKCGFQEVKNIKD